MKKLSALASLALVAAAAAVAAPDPVPQSSASAPAEADLQTVAASNRAFGLALYKRLAAKPGNVFISPISLAGAFGPVAAGAQGETRAAIGKALRFPSDDARLHPQLGSLLRTLESDSAGARVSIANALWLMKDYPVKPAFVDVAKDSYGAAVDNLDFRNGEAAAARINSWADQETSGKVRNLVDPRTLDELTVVVVTNAVHFLGDWQVPFRVGRTSNQPFFLADGTTKQVPLMNGRRLVRYAETDGVHMIELPYKGERLSMVAILPRKRNGLAAVEAKLTGARLEGWLGKLDAARSDELDIDLPRVTVEASYQLNEPLKAMGMAVAFDRNRANFTGIADGPRLFISQVVHKTFLKIDEKGTEAAAATAVEIQAESSRPTFRADHPFLVLIRDRQTGALLFMGRIADPTAQ